MKQFFIFLLLLAFSANIFSQENKSTPALTKQDYLQKSKKQRTTAWILFGGGTALFVAGTIAYQEGPGGLILMGVGLLAGVISCPFFIAASINKKKGLRLAFNYQTVPQLLKYNFAYRSLPSLSLKVSL